MNDGGVVVHYLFNLDRGLCDFSTAAASVLITDWACGGACAMPQQAESITQEEEWSGVK